MSENRIPENQNGALQAFQGMRAYPLVLDLLRRQERQLAQIIECLANQNVEPAPDRWLDAKGAAEYMGISMNTFDKYRYNSTPRLKGSKLDGKTLYKRSDLDSYIRLYEVKSTGLA